MSRPFSERFVAVGLDYKEQEVIDGPYGHLKLHFAEYTRIAEAR